MDIFFVGILVSASLVLPANIVRQILTNVYQTLVLMVECVSTSSMASDANVPEDILMQDVLVTLMNANQIPVKMEASVKMVLTDLFVTA